MITPNQIADKAARLYPKAIKTWLGGSAESFFPIRIPANLKLPSAISDAVRQVEALREASKQVCGYGYSVDWQSRQSRTHGLNQFPAEISIESMDDLVRLIGKTAAWRQLQIDVQKLRNRQPQLEAWLCEATNWKSLLEVSSNLDGLLDVLDYFWHHPRPDCFARELPLAISTKLIENHRRQLAIWLDRILPAHTIDARYGYEAFEPRYGLRYARPHFLFRILDDTLVQEIGLPFDELSLPAQSLSKLALRDIRVLIVENKINLLTLPPLTRGVALGGIGNAVTQLSEIEWLHQNSVYYWGDLDAEGFEILSRLRERLPRVKSFLMDREIFEALKHFAIAGNTSARENAACLDAEEMSLYRELRTQKQRLEQEKVSIETVTQAYKTML